MLRCGAWPLNGAWLRPFGCCYHHIYRCSASNSIYRSAIAVAIYVSLDYPFNIMYHKKYYITYNNTVATAAMYVDLMIYS